MASNISAEAIDSETKRKLKGDQIGDTMYSESFIVRTLLRFKDNDWNDDFETDLCFLWDMTTEEIICDYLFRLSFPSIACDVLTNQQENRLVEIVIGVLGNIYISEKAPIVNPLEIERVLAHMDTDDHLILIQIMRFIKVISYKAKEKIDFITSDVLQKMLFILSNSLNVDLLDNTLEALVKITDGSKLDVSLLVVDLIKPAMDAYETVCDSEIYEDINIYILKPIKKATTQWVQILLNLAANLQTTSINELVAHFNTHSETFLNEFNNVLCGYVKDDELLSYSDDLIFIIEAIGFLCPAFNYKSNLLFNTVLVIFSTLVDDLDDNERNIFIDVLCYFISVTDTDNKINMKPICSKGLKYIKNCNFDSDCNYSDNLNILLTTIDNVK